MNNLNLKELQLIREALEHVALKADTDTFKEVRDKVDAALYDLGYKWETKAFESRWKKLNK